MRDLCHKIPPWFAASVASGGVYWSNQLARQFHFPDSSHSLTTLLVTTGTGVVFAFLLERFVPFGRKLLLFSGVMAVGFLLGQTSRSSNIGSLPLPFGLKIAIVAGFFLLAALFAVRFYGRDRGLIPAFVTLFTIVWFGSAYVTYTVNLLPPTRVLSMEALAPLGPSPRATIVLLLDESSPNVASTYVGALDGLDVDHNVSLVRAAGPNTTNSIPGMFTGVAFEGMRACLPSVLCSARRSLDFRTLTAARPDVDIIGFWHPYCDIGGLRSCFREPMVFFRSLIATVLCSDVTLQRLTDCSITEGTLERQLSTMLGALDAAPLWKDGGVLMAHLPLPHPSMERADTDLARSYEKNTTEASRQIAVLTKRLIDQFPGDFRLIITTDHPLRVDAWCKAGMIYASARCGEGLPPDEGIVPLITVVPKGKLSDLGRTDNLGLLK